MYSVFPVAINAVAATAWLPRRKTARAHNDEPGGFRVFRVSRGDQCRGRERVAAAASIRASAQRPEQEASVYSVFPVAINAVAANA